MKRTFFALALIAVAASSALAQSKVIVSASDPYPPFVDPENPKEGLSLEIARAAYATQGYTMRHEYVPWARAEEGVKNGTYDLLPNTWMTEKRKAYLMYSEPYGANEVKFIKRKGDPFEYKGMDSLKGKTIGLVRGYGYGDAFLSSNVYKREEEAEFMTNVKKVVGKRVDLTLEDAIVARVAIGKVDPALLAEIQFTENSLSSNKLYVTSGLKNPRCKELIDAFNKGLEIIKKNGTYDKIMSSYGIK